MKLIAKALFFVMLALPMLVMAQESHHWLHVYRNDRNFLSSKLEGDESIVHSTVPGHEMARFNLQQGVVDIPLCNIDSCVFGTNVPTIYIDINDNPNLTELREKETYLDATVSIDGNGVADDLSPTHAKIKGRGNSTWWFPKKPYRLKFDKKTSVPGCRKGKSYVLIANYIDCTLMRNAVAFEAARLLGMPFTNNTQPVRLYFNGIFKGAYFISEKIGIGGQSVDIDEKSGVLFELDNNYDETYRFRSPIYDLPVMIKDPDLDEVAADLGTSAQELLAKWEAEFVDFEKKVKNGTLVDGKDIDMASLIDFLIVFNLCGNRELTWPKSVYIYKESAGAPIHFGPVWDFDWAFTYNNGEETKSPDIQLLAPWTPLLGQPFFKKLCSSNAFLEAYGQRWQQFREQMLPQLFEFMDQYAAAIEPSAIENGVVWPAEPTVTDGSFDFKANVSALRQWLSARADYISTHPRHGLFD